ncbi:RecQ-mediated genome instability protein 2 [Tanacetum coccineum]
MDYNLAALKLFSTQLSSARPAHDSSQSHLLLGPILFQRAWIQGVVISLPSTTAAAGDGGDGGRFVVDDGTGVVELLVPNDVLNRGWKLGDYVMVVGVCGIRKDDIPFIRHTSSLSTLEFDVCFAKVHKIVDLSAFPHREAMWYLEVLEAYKLFYQSSIEEDLLTSNK